MAEKQGTESKRAVDPRPARTRAAIRDAVRRLAAQSGEGPQSGSSARASKSGQSVQPGQSVNPAQPAKPAQEISVNAIAREAGVSRSAFYDQYSDLDALSIDLLTTIFHDAAALDLDARTHGRSLREGSRDAVAAFLDNLDEHRTFFVSSLEWKTSSRVAEAVRNAMAANYLRTFEFLGNAVPSHLNHGDTALFLAGGTLALITDWMRHDQATPKAELVERILDQHPAWLSGSRDDDGS